MLEIERAMLNILCEAKEGIPAIITIKNTETGEVKKGQITLNGDKAIRLFNPTLKNTLTKTIITISVTGFFTLLFEYATLK